MNMKTLLLCLCTICVLSSCDPNADKQVGQPNRVSGVSTNNGSGVGSGGGGADAGGASNTTDAPLDGGLSLLLLAGTAYGVQKVRRSKQQKAAD